LNNLKPDTENQITNRASDTPSVNGEIKDGVFNSLIEPQGSSSSNETYNWLSDEEWEQAKREAEKYRKQLEAEYYEDWTIDHSLKLVEDGIYIPDFLKCTELSEERRQYVTTRVALAALGREYHNLDTVLELTGLNKNELETLIEVWYYPLRAWNLDDLCRWSGLRFKKMEDVDMIVKRLLRLGVSKEQISEATKMSIEAIAQIEHWLLQYDLEQQRGESH